MRTLEERQREFTFREEPIFRFPRGLRHLNSNPIERKFQRSLHFTPAREQAFSIRQTLLGRTGSLPSFYNWHTRQGRQTQIEALQHGGMAGETRRLLTGFGSGWRGLVKVPETLSGILPDSEGLTVPYDITDPFVSEVNELVDNVVSEYQKMGETLSDSDVSQVSKFRSELAQAGEWAHHNQQGFMIYQGGSISPRTILRHERIHSYHYKYHDHPFFRSEVNRSPELQQGVRQHYAGQPMDLMFPGYAEEQGQHAEKHYSEQRRSLNAEEPGRGDQMYDSERLAWSNQNDRSFFGRMREAGVAPPQNVNPRFASAEKLKPAAAGEHVMAATAKMVDPRPIMKAGACIHETRTAKSLAGRLFSSLRMPKGL